MPGVTVRLFVCGDVMLGRGVDQILPSPGDPTLREGHVTDARRYVELAEEVNGPIPRPVDPSWPWGEALTVLETAAPDVRIVNLETSITHSDRFAAGKAVHYRMSPDNLGCLEAVGPDVCTLANNHVLDLGREGLEETLDVLTAAGLRSAGAGHDLEEAWQPVVVPLGGGGRVVVFSMGSPDSGIPPCGRPRRTVPASPSSATPSTSRRQRCSTASGGGGGPATGSWCPSTGARTGATTCRAITSASPTR